MGMGRRFQSPRSSAANRLPPPRSNPLARRNLLVLSQRNPTTRHPEPSIVKPRSLAVALLLTCFVPTAAVHAANDLALPDIGDSSATALPPAEAKRIGSDMMLNIRQSGKLINDPQIESYIQDIGHRLASASPKGGDGFYYFVVKDPSINAFAMPGDYIGVNSGLILATQNESQLAAVLAHETAHEVQHHLARSYEKASKMNMPLTAAVLAAILLGANNPQAGEATLAASMAGSSAAQLTFSRANEREADRVGMQLLAAAGFDPYGMPDFFEQLEQRYRFSDGTVPAFLIDHPVTQDRIADARNRAAQYPRVNYVDSVNYHLMKARLRVMEAPDVSALNHQIATELKDGTYSDDIGEHYAYALTLTATGHYAAARDQLMHLMKHDPERIAYLLALADVDTRSKRPAAARAIYKHGLEFYPDNDLLIMGYADFMLLQGESKQAAALLDEYTRTQDDAPPGAYQMLADAEEQLGQKGVSHLALADYYTRIGEIPTAIEQLHLARRSHDLDFYHRSIVDAKLKQLQQQLPPKAHGAGNGKNSRDGE